MKRITSKPVHIDADQYEDNGHPISTMKCGARVYGERLGHCVGPGCGWPTGCCRTFWGNGAFNRHYRMIDGRKVCLTEDQLHDNGFVQDRPEGAWRLNTDHSSDPHEVEGAEE